LVGRAGVAGDHGAEAGGRHEDAGRADHVHQAAGVDFVVQPGAAGVVEDACPKKKKTKLVEDRSCTGRDK
jgi:hypothetical protein